MRCDGVFFDLDGTLLNTLGDIAAALNYVMEQNGFPTRTLEEVRSFIGDGFDVLLKLACPENAAFPDKATTHKMFSEYYLNHMEDTTVPYEGIPELIRRLKNEGYALGVVSNKHHSAVTTLVSDYFGDVFQVALGERGENTRKPSPFLCNEGMSALSLSPERTLYVGDSPSDIQTAFNAGMIPVGVTWGFRSREQLENAGATLIAENADELYSIISDKIK